MTWRRLYVEAVRELGAPQEARWLVEDLSDSPWPSCLDEMATIRVATRFTELVHRRRRGEPLQYVLGRWGFRTLDLMLDRRVLIPRPETEGVVQVALEHLDLLARREPVVVDLGTGSGAIGLAVAAERPGTRVWATDESSDALDVARANLAGLGGEAATAVRLVHGSWWEALPNELERSVDLAVSNPPYISIGEMAKLPAAVAEWEPVGALRAGPTGLEDINAILVGATDWLCDGGYLVIEIAPHQSGEARGLAREAGFPTAGIDVHRDLAGQDRVLVARMGYLRRPMAR